MPQSSVSLVLWFRVRAMVRVSLVSRVSCRSLQNNVAIWSMNQQHQRFTASNFHALIFRINRRFTVITNPGKYVICGTEYAAAPFCTVDMLSQPPHPYTRVDVKNVINLLATAED